MISVHWKVGNETGTALHAGFQPGFSQIHVARYVHTCIYVQ